MPESSDPTDAVVDTGNGRYVVERDGEIAELVYEIRGDRFVISHVGVPEAIAHHGLAASLVAAAVERARTEGLLVVPACPYARAWLRDHPEIAATVTGGDRHAVGEATP